MQQRLVTVRILWGALFTSTALFLVVLQFAKNPEPNPIPMMPPALAAVAVMIAVASFLLPKQISTAAFKRSNLEVDLH